MICTGFTQGINILLRALARAGVDRVAVEDPGDRDNDTVGERAGLQPVPVRWTRAASTPGGWRRTARGQWFSPPAHQALTGVVLAPERRQALIAWAADGMIIEDDHDAEFRYDRQPLQRYGTPRRDRCR